MLGGMQDWPLRIMRILDHAAREHGRRELVSHYADGSTVRTDWAGIGRDARKLAQALVRLGLLGGLGFGVLFVGLGQIPEAAGTLPLALNQLTGALVTVAIATVVRQTWQPSRAAAGWGLASGLLGVAGSLAFAAFRHVRLPVLAAVATTAVALAYALMGLAPSLALACAGAALGGAGNGAQWVAVATWVQRLAPRDTEARVAALLESVAVLAPGAGFLLGGALVRSYSP